MMAVHTFTVEIHGGGKVRAPHRSARHAIALTRPRPSVV
jgi:hypothetical protein